MIHAEFGRRKVPSTTRRETRPFTKLVYFNDLENGLSSMSMCFGSIARNDFVEFLSVNIRRAANFQAQA